MKRLKNFVSPRANTNSEATTPKSISARKHVSKSTATSRPPLTIRISTSPTPKETVDVLQEQVSTLADRIALLNKESTVQDDRQENEFKHINDQLQEIQHGLSHVVKERQTLRTSTAILESEKRDIQEQLFIREREVQSLVRRCQSQEEKMRESAKIRVFNSNLSTQLEGLKSSLSMKEEEISQVEDLQKELTQCKESRDEMRSRWEKVKKDHDDVVDTLNSCFLNMQKMQEKLQEHDEDRKREMKRAEVVLEKQRLQQQEKVNELNAENQSRQERVEQMEKILRDNMVTATSLRRERVELKRSLEEELSRNEALARRVADLEMEENQSMKAAQLEHDCTVRDLQGAVAEKDFVIEKLQNEVSSSMERLMRVSEEAHELQEEKSLQTCNNQARVAQLEREILTLKGEVSTKDIDITVLSSSISMIEEEKAEFISELMRLRLRVKELEEENAFIMDMEQQLDDVNLSVFEAHEDNGRIRETYEQRLVDLQKHFDLQKNMWDEMEKGLNERLAAMESEKAKLVASVAYEQEVCRTMHASVQLFESKQERLQQQAVSQDELLVDIQDQLERQRRLAGEKDVQISQLRARNDEVKNAAAGDRENYEKTLKSLRQHLDEERTNFDEKCDELKRISHELALARDEFQSQLIMLKGQLHSQEAAISSSMDRLQLERRSKIDIVKSLREENEVARQGWKSEMDELNMLLLEKRSQVESLQSELIRISGRGEEEQIAADRTLKVHGERLDCVQNELDEQTRCLQQKSVEAERFRNELEKIQDQMQFEVLSKLEMVSKHEQNIASLEADLRRERSACEGKDSDLQSMVTEVVALRQELVQEKQIAHSHQKEAENLRRLFDGERDQRDELLKSHVQEMSLLTTELNTKQELLDSVTDQRDSLQRTLSTDSHELSKLRDHVQLHVQKIEKLHAQLIVEKEETAICREQIDKLEGRLEEVTDDLTNHVFERATLREERVGLQTEMAVKDAMIKLHIEQLSSFERQVEQFRALADTKAAALDDLKAELSTVRSSYELDIAVARKKIADEQSLVSLLQADVHRTNLELHTRETHILSLTADIENYSFKFDQESKTSKKLLADKEETIARKESELSSIKSLLEEGTSVLREELRNQSAKVCSLTKALTQMEFDGEEKERKLRALQVENDAKISGLLQELQTIRQGKNIISEQFRETIKEKEESISALNKRVEELHHEMETRSSANQAEMNSLKHKLQQVEMDLAISEDELRDLKVIDLKEAEETIESLESNLHTMRMKARNQEASSNATISELQAQLRQLEVKRLGAERGMTDAKHLHDKTIAKLQGELEVVNKENKKLNVEVADKFKRLSEHHNTITNLSAEKAELERNENRLIAKVSSLESECQKAWGEHEKISAALERAIMDSSRKADDIELLQKQANLEKRLLDYERKHESLQKELGNAEELLECRTQVLADMVAHNKEAEERKERALDDLQAEKTVSEERKVMIEGLQQDISRLKLNFSKVEDELLVAIHNEREFRESAELELENLYAKMKTKRDDRELTELEKENEALRDKVRRQEAFLLRKIQKDKVLRDRNVKPSGIATPARTSGLRKPVSSSRKGRLTPVSSENLGDDELDDLLS